MTHISATAFCVWSVMSCALGAFLIGHLWRFDRFNCLRWSSSPYSGAFKRLMTYTYLLTVPLIMTYCFGFTFMKYKEGWMSEPGGGVVPTPYYLWPDSYQKAIFPLNMTFAFGWSFELITHLEELCFWLFLMTTGSRQPDWFRSPYFRFWAVGSIAALVYVPLVTGLYRENPLTCEAYMFLAGSIGDLVLTLAFVPILIKFPSFLMKVKAEGVDTSTMVRLRKFHELNIIRVVFRFLFSVPLLSLGIDGVKGHTHHLNESMFWTDLFIIITALGCVFSSVCTLLIFFPRSYEAEYQAKEASIQRGPQSTRNSRYSRHSRNESQRSIEHDKGSQTSRVRSSGSVSMTVSASIRPPRVSIAKRRQATSPGRRPWLMVGKGGSGKGGIGVDVDASPQLPIQVPIENEETGAGAVRPGAGVGGEKKYVPRPLPMTPGHRKDSGGSKTFLLTDSPIAQTQTQTQMQTTKADDLPSPELGLVNSAGLTSGVDPFNSSPILPSVVAFRAPENYKTHPESYYEGEDKYNEFGYEVEYDPDPDPWMDGKRPELVRERDDEDGDSDKDKGKDGDGDGDLSSPTQDAFAGLPQIPYNSNSNSQDQHQHSQGRTRAHAINFSRPMRGEGESYRTPNSRSRNANPNAHAHVYGGNGSGSGAQGNALGLTLENVQRHNAFESEINPIVHSFMSPLDVFERTPRHTPKHTPRQSWV